MPYPPARWRLLLSPLADGPTNMAVDEAILLAVAGADAPPTLRFFGWTPPCLSLGYAQPAGDADPGRLRRYEFDLVRRPTGGRAILHTDELTYSVIALVDEPRVRGGVVESYRRLSAGLMRGLELLGLAVRADKEHPAPSPVTPGSTLGENPHVASRASGRHPPPGPVCFEAPSPYEITVGEAGRQRKLLGSAQVRRRGGVLQHGTLPLAGDIARICDVLAFASETGRRRQRARVHQRATTLAEVMGREITLEEAAGAMARGFADALNLTLEAAALSPKESDLAAQLREEKYITEAWNYRV